MPEYKLTLFDEFNMTNWKTVEKMNAETCWSTCELHTKKPRTYVCDSN